MAQTQKSQELKDLDVDRVDGVDKPATGRSFLLFKGANGDAIMKGYGMTATAAHLVLKAIRTDKNFSVSRKSAIALNGLAQVLGEDAVFVGKSVPTQPYEFTEPDQDKRGPADEDLGGNFTPRSMPGSMVGSVQFRMKDEDENYDDRKAKGIVKDEDEDDAKAKAKAAKVAAKAAAAKAAAKAAMDDDEDDDDDEDSSDASEKANRKVKREKSIAAAVAKALMDMGLVAPVSKSEDDEPEPVKRGSRQIQEDDQPVRVRKSDDGYQSRFGVGFGNVVFGGK